MENELEAEYTITEDEYVQANSLYARPTKKHLMIFASVIVTLIIVAIVAGDSILRGAAIGGLIGSIGGFLIIRFIISPWRTRKFYRSYAAIKEPCTVKIEDQGVRFKSKMGVSLIEWKHILKWRDNEKFVLIYQAPHLYHLIPKRLGNIEEKLTAELAKNVGLKS